MPGLGRRSRRHRAPPVTAGSRRVLVVQLPRAPGAAVRPAPLSVPLPAGLRPWALPHQREPLRQLASFLAVLDVAPPGPVLDVAAGAGEHALLAAVYGTRPVRAVEADAVRAHAARQAAASNALPVVVEEFRVAGPGEDRRAGGETLDGYVERTALEPAVVHVGRGADAAAVLAGGAGLIGRRRPWIVVESARQAGQILLRLPEMVALGYRLITEMTATASPHGYVLAPEAVGSAFRRRVEAWSAALPSPVEPATTAGVEPAVAVVDLRPAEGAGAAT
ncbi:MAG: hypothetical protein ACXV0U_09395 [Kineosporiaceae bacterium]